ncbi:hypothetical protein RRG08_046847 [Elysia crispata]|uniref:Uncharacterized protein n=1 Tax=Elysia crispata TaxID=231223 RepID=A0AAE1DJ02_9GAST|nr:hypothetical protein RRG08_046847 [Elysia crispata]
MPWRTPQRDGPNWTELSEIGTQTKPTIKKLAQRPTSRGEKETTPGQRQTDITRMLSKEREMTITGIWLALASSPLRKFKKTPSGREQSPASRTVNSYRSSYSRV